jgi:hypothetical protein
MLLSLAHHFVNINKPKKHKRVDGHVMVAFGCTISSRLPLGHLCTQPGSEPAPQFLGADSTHYKRSMVVNFPLSTIYMQELEALLSGQPVNTDILTQEEEAAPSTSTTSSQPEALLKSLAPKVCGFGM